MAPSTKAIPDGYHTLTPYLIIKGAAQAIEFYKKAFAAEEIRRIKGPGNTVGHAEVRIGNSIFMIAEDFPDMPDSKSPATLGGSPVSLMLAVENADSAFDRAVKAGAKVVRPIEDQFYGDRLGSVQDPFGYTWHVATHIEDLSDQEMQRRADAKFGAAAQR